VSAIFDMAGRAAFVTGAASGLGFAMAEAMAEAGAAVCLADIDPQGLAKAQDHFRQFSNRVEAQELDVRDADAVHAAVRGFAERQGRLDAVFANAGITGGAPISQPDGYIENIDLKVWNDVIAVNLTGVFVTLQAAAAIMKPQNGGRIIATASIAGMQTSDVSGYAYSTTKAGVIHLVHLAAAELAQYNIRVNGIAPGPFMTNIAGGRMFREPDRVAMMAAGTGLNRVADPSELKGLALLLASEASSFITGQVIPIDGGSLVKRK
jgi:NAD(P)-dependent dehydrogenase (short-subunit alcohol dehydrogenase family)